MRNDRTKHVVLILFWVMIASIAGYYLYQGISSGGINFETKHTGEPSTVLSDVTLDSSITSVTIDWVSGGVKILPTTDSKIRIVEKAYEPVDKSKWVDIRVTGSALQLKTQNKPLFNILGLMSNSTYLEVYLPITVNYDLIQLNGVSGSYSIDEVYANQTQIKLISGNLDYKNSYSALFMLTMTSGHASISDSQLLNSSIKMTSGKLDYAADTLSCSVSMTSGLADLAFGPANPDALNLSMTSGSSNVTLHGSDPFSVNVDKTSGLFNPGFDFVQNGKTYVHGSGGPTYQITMTSGKVDLIAD